MSSNSSTDFPTENTNSNSCSQIEKDEDKSVFEPNQNFEINNQPLFEINNFNDNLSLDQIEVIKTTAVDISPKKDGTLLKLVLKAGIGDSKPLFDDIAYVRYEAWNEDGEKVASCHEDFSFVVGKADVLIAWEFAIGSMTEAEMALFVCMADMVVGSEDLPPNIPQHSTLICHLQLIRWHGEDISEKKEGILYRSVLEKGESYGGPNAGARCTVEIVGRCQGREFERREVEFDFGEGEVVGIVDGVERAVGKCSRGEKVRLKVGSRLAYGAEGCTEQNIPPNCDLEYDVHLKQCQREKDFWDMRIEEKIEQSLKDKQKGVDYFKEGKYKLAVKFFKRIMEFVVFVKEKDLEQQMKVDMLSSAMVNLGLCQLKVDDPFGAEDWLGQALAVNGSNKKALYNRAQANRKMKNFEMVVTDLKKLIEVGGGSSTVRQQLEEALIEVKEYKAVEKKRYFGMFDKIKEDGDA